MNKLKFGDLFNLSSVTQPALTTRISYMLSKQNVIHINILFVTESWGTGIYTTGIFW